MERNYYVITKRGLDISGPYTSEWAHIKLSAAIVQGGSSGCAVVQAPSQDDALYKYESRGETK